MKGRVIVCFDLDPATGKGSYQTAACDDDAQALYWTGLTWQLLGGIAEALQNTSEMFLTYANQVKEREDTLPPRKDN